MYAIIEDGGRQYKVEEGQEIVVDYRDAHKGDELTFNRVLAISSDDGFQLGKPTIDQANVVAEIVGVKQADKLVVQKIRRRKNYRRKTGHRQIHTTVRISKIDAGASK